MQHLIEIRDATQEDFEYIADHLRDADIEELLLAQPEAPAEAVRKSAGYSLWTKCVLVDGVPAVLYGVSPTDVDEFGSPWMLATDGIRHIRREFIRGCKAEVEKMRTEFEFLMNQVHWRNAVSINWLRWLGFYVDNKPTGPGNEFFDFWMGDCSCATR